MWKAEPGWQPRLANIVLNNYIAYTKVTLTRVLLYAVGRELLRNTMVE